MNHIFWTVFLLTKKTRRQKDFFKKLDACTLDDDVLRPSPSKPATTERISPWEHTFTVRMQALRAQESLLSPSHVRVLEAACFLLRGGLLNVKNTSNLNVKQGRAFLHWAWWLHQVMSQRWVEDGKLEPPPGPLTATPLHHVLTGGAGCGKTTTLRVVAALVD